MLSVCTASFVRFFLRVSLLTRHQGMGMGGGMNPQMGMQGGMGMGMQPGMGMVSAVFVIFCAAAHRKCSVCLMFVRCR